MRFLLIDRVVEFTPWSRTLAIKNVSREADYLAEHFPGFPVFPGALTLESMAQTAGYLVVRSGRVEGGRTLFPMLHSVLRANFVRMARPGDQIVIEVVVQRVEGPMVTLGGTARVAGKVSARAVLMLAHRDITDAAGRDRLTTDVERMWGGLDSDELVELQGDH